MRDKLTIAGGIVEIIGGALALTSALLVRDIANYFGASFDWIQIIAPLCFILYGILACTGKRKKSDLITFGVLNLVFVAFQIFGIHNYAGLGIIQMVLLIVASLLFFVAKEPIKEPEKKDSNYVNKGEKNE